MLVAGNLAVFAAKEEKGILKITFITMHLGSGRCSVDGLLGDLGPSQATGLYSKRFRGKGMSGSRSASS
jgi:hypothetical protein